MILAHKGVSDTDWWDQQAIHDKLQELDRGFNEKSMPDSMQSMNYSLTDKGSAILFRRAKRQERQAKDQASTDPSLTKNKLGLRKVLREQKVKNIIRKFGQKLRRNLTTAGPIEYEPFAKPEQHKFWLKEGLVLPNWLDLLLAALSILQIFGLFFIYTLSLVFEQLNSNKYIYYFQVGAALFYGVEVVLNLVTVKTIKGKKIVRLGDIVTDYLASKIKIDLTCFIILAVDLGTSSTATQYLRLCIILKLSGTLYKMQKIQNALVTNFYQEQYWSLAKVFLTNFAFAHCLAILLIAMSFLSHSQNWLHKIGIQDCDWYEIYAWAYYWGTTTMLTVGFGDLTPGNYKQALCLTVIETFSCILLAYNINCVGTLINNIRSQDIQKNKNLKVLRRLAAENKITDDLEWRVCNYVNELDKMRKKFQFETDRKFVSSLPLELKGQFLKQSNIKLFKNLPFFSCLTEKALLGLAEKIELKFAHPEEIIFKGKEPHKILILRDGKVGYCTKIPSGKYNHTMIDTVRVKKEETPQFLHLNFFTNICNPKYTIKSVEYSILGVIEFDKAEEFLKSCSLPDFENFCQIRDTSKHIIDQFQILKCEYCPTKHSKMSCPRLHYMPIAQQVIYKHLEKVKRGVCFRISTHRPVKSKMHHPYEYFRHRVQSQHLVGTKSKTLKQKTLKNYKSFASMNMGFLQHLPTETFSTQQEIEKDKRFLDKLGLLLTEKISNIFQDISNENNNGIHWDIECDEIKNFSHYFTNFNPDNLLIQVYDKVVRMEPKGGARNPGKVKGLLKYIMNLGLSDCQ